MIELVAYDGIRMRRRRPPTTGRPPTPTPTQLPTLFINSPAKTVESSQNSISFPHSSDGYEIEVQGGKGREARQNSRRVICMIAEKTIVLLALLI